jgi:hypothetical protein
MSSYNLEKYSITELRKMAEKIVSPGVFTNEKDLSFLPAGIAAIGAAIVGPTRKGPAFVPTIINNFEEFSNDTKIIYNSIYAKLDQYKIDTGIEQSTQLPKQFDFEVLRIKKYNANEGEHRSHVDVVDHGTARRFLQFCVYLNDDFEEGGTKFNQTGYTVKPKKGKLFVFPPLWPWLHHGQKPIGNNKYFLATYLLYKD